MKVILFILIQSFKSLQSWLLLYTRLYTTSFCIVLIPIFFGTHSLYSCFCYSIMSSINLKPKYCHFSFYYLYLFSLFSHHLIPVHPYYELVINYRKNNILIYRLGKFLSQTLSFYTFKILSIIFVDTNLSTSLIS